MTILEIRIALRDVAPPVWRRILVPSEISLPDLHLVIQAVMGWNNVHLYQFVIGRDRYTSPYADDPDAKVATKARLVEAAGGHSQLVYDYDFGDGWRHDLFIDRIIDGPTNHFACLGGERACPPEDSGGPHGYQHLLDVLADPADPEYPDLRAWVPAEFDPNRFDLEVTNQILRMETASMRRRLGKPKPKRSKSRAPLPWLRVKPANDCE